VRFAQERDELFFEEQFRVVLGFVEWASQNCNVDFAFPGPTAFRAQVLGRDPDVRATRGMVDPNAIDRAPEAPANTHA
jgi:hypothetical protein